MCLCLHARARTYVYIHMQISACVFVSAYMNFCVCVSDVHERPDGHFPTVFEIDNHPTMDKNSIVIASRFLPLLQTSHMQMLQQWQPEKF